MNSWFPLGETVWEELGGVTLLEKVGHWGLALLFQKVPAITVGSSPFCLMATHQGMSSQLFLPLTTMDF